MNAVGKTCYKEIHRLDEKCPWCVHEKVQQGEHAEIEIVNPKDGRSYHVSNSPIFHEDGSISKMTIYRDITDSKQKEEELRHSEEKYRAVLEQSADNIHILDVQTKKILETNATLQKLLGYTAEEMKELKVYDFVEDDQKNIDQKIAAMVKQKQAFIGRRQYLKKDGTTVDVEVSANLIIYGDREALCVVSRDITSRNQTEMRIDSINRLKENLLKSIGLEEKLKLITDEIVTIFDADFARIWIIRPGDKCESNCTHAKITEGPHVCQHRDRCLHRYG